LAIFSSPTTWNRARRSDMSPLPLGSRPNSASMASDTSASRCHSSSARASAGSSPISSSNNSTLPGCSNGVIQFSAVIVELCRSASRCAKLIRPISVASCSVSVSSKKPSTIRTPRSFGTSVAKVPFSRCS
jgi:hypothetical protein